MADPSGVKIRVVTDGDIATPPSGKIHIYATAAGPRYKDSTGTASPFPAGVTTFNSRSGAVVPLVGDYSSFFDATGAAAAAQAASQPLDTTLTALAAQNWAANALPIGSGADTVAQVAFAANTFPARSSSGNLVAKAITDYAISTVLGFADALGLTAAVNVATTALKGLMSSVDKLKMDNLYYDATANSIANLIGDDSTDNLANFNTLYAALPVNAVLYFPPGTYRFSGELTMNRNLQMKFMGAGPFRSILKATTSTTAHLFNFTIDAYYYTFQDLGFTTNVTKTAGAAINATHDNAGMEIFHCDFNNQFIGIDWSGSNPGNVGGIYTCTFSAPKANGFQIRINGANINTMVRGCTINCTGVAAIGIEINQSGAVQIAQCDIIGGTNALRVNATATVSAIYCTNVFFDQATLGSTVKFMGTAAISRVKFVQCGITNGAANLAACEIAGTGTGTSIPEAIDFLMCDFYNNGFTGTTTGLLITGVRGIDIRACRISGFTNGIDITPYSANDVTNFGIVDNTIGPTENFAGNGTGIMVRTGSVAFGKSTINFNDMSGNTTAAYNGNAATFTGAQLDFKNNIGYAITPSSEFPATLIPLTTPVTRAGSGWSLPANILRPGTHLRITVGLTCAATAQTLSPTIKFGTANTNADADLIATPTALGAGTAVLGSCEAVYDFHVLSSTTAIANMKFYNGGVAGVTGVTNAAFQSRGSAGPITINPAVANFLAPYFVSATASAVTVRSVTYEVVSQ